MKLLIFQAVIALASAHPGLLRVPKVYNAVVTSNQNLSPSRAFPVIQPVVHRTAIGYVPPFYYTQVGTPFRGPELAYPQSGPKLSPSQAEIEADSSAPASVDATKPEENGENERKEGSISSPKKKNEEQVPLSFYPNYQSLYYDPYFYTYNGFNPHFVPGSYYVDYQPYGSLDPIPASTPKNSGHLLPGYHEEKKDSAKVQKEKIPDVPPPPVPTALPKSS